MLPKEPSGSGQIPVGPCSDAFDWQEKDILPLEEANERSEPGAGGG